MGWLYVAFKPSVGGNMQVGDLVKWEDSDGNPEYGIVMEPPVVRWLVADERAFVYFAEDGHGSWISASDLEVISESR